MPRYYEVNVDPKFKAENDFVHRKRHGSLWRTGILYVIGMIFIIFSSLYREHIGGDISFLLFTTIVIGMLTFHSIITVQKHLDLVLSIEFQNALFSSAFKEGKIFSMIVSQDDQLFYADPEFYRLYPHLVKQNTQILDAIAQTSDTPQENLEALNLSLINKTRETLDIYVNIDDKYTKARLTIIPLARPDGYFFVSARIYHENRKAHHHEAEKYAQPNVHNERADAETILDALTQHMSVPAYILSDDGLLQYVTHPFAQMLEYNSVDELRHTTISELLGEGQHLSVNHLFHTNEPVDESVFFVTQSGIRKYVTLSHKPIGSSGTYMLGTMTLMN